MDGQGAGLYGFQHSSAPVKKVDNVQFGILSPEEIVILRCLWCIYSMLKQQRNPCRSQR